ncbi:hypothetical protein [Weissella minor]|uniref:hypothetical protein n=1 Tax=Weissella minor TaxID=1620 RepID=UPI00070A30D4|nr:hypothetical protein [Weissella minor]
MNKLKKIEEKVSKRQRTLYVLFVTSLVMFGYWNSWQYIPWSLRFTLLTLMFIFIIFSCQADMYSEQLKRSKEHLNLQANEIALKKEKIREQQNRINEWVN